VHSGKSGTGPDDGSDDYDGKMILTSRVR
jgi:hypothetical protein